MPTFQKYAEYYDLLYHDKDYTAESQYVADLIDKFCPRYCSLLDVGCGTGRHASAFVRNGIDVAGVDSSDGMLSAGRATYPEIKFYQGCAESFRLPQQFDVITSLFHVVSYLTGNSQLAEAFENIYHHLNDNGIFIFDFWYGPAVLTEKPAVKIKRVKNERYSLIRISEPEILYNENVVNVNFDLLIKDLIQDKTEEVKETHRMRYFFLPELELILQRVGFKLLSAQQWMSGGMLSEKSWNGIIVAQK